MLFGKPLLTLLVFISSVYSFNHPEIQWKTVSTEHFKLNYYDKTESAVYATWKIAEQTFSAIAPLFDYKFQRKIEISLADYDDYSNGWADFTNSSIMISLPDSRFAFRGSTTWLRNVLTHEITHILSLENRKRLQLIDITANVQFSTPDEQIIVQEPFARMSLYPNWFAEGVAQRQSERMGNDCWDSRREMLLRTAVLSNSLLSLEEMSYFNHNSRDNELVYNQGLSLVHFIENRLGENSLLSLLKVGSENKIDFSRYFNETSGKSLQSFYSDWRDSLTQHYKTTFPEQNDAEMVLFKRGTYNLMPKVSPDGKLWGWLTSGRDDGDRTDLIICGNGDTKVKYRIPFAKECWTFSYDSKEVFFIRSKDPDTHGSYLNDLYSFNLENTKITALTKNKRIYSVTQSPVNGDLAVTMYNGGVFSLAELNKNTGTMKELIKGALGEPIISCSWNPKDSNLLAVEKIVNGRSIIFVCDTKSSLMHQVTSGKAREEFPYWANDGRIYYCADYDGVYNIYSLNEDGSDLKRYTSTIGGCFYPYANAEGVFYSGYSKTGFTISKSTQKAYSYEIPSNEYCSFKPLPVPKGKVVIKAENYTPHLGRSLYELQIFGSLWRNKGLFSNNTEESLDTSDIQIGAALVSQRTDALNKKSSMLGVAIGMMNLKNESDSGSDDRWSPWNRSDIQKKGPGLANAIGDKFKNNKKFSKSNIYKERFSQFEQSLDLKTNNSTDVDSENNDRTTVAFLQPVYSLINNQYAATYGLDISASMLMMILPVEVNANIYSERQLTKNLEAGISVSSYIYPFSHDVFATIPFTLNWSNTGYYNKELQYNYNDYSQLSISAGPQFLPQSKEGGWNDNTGEYDTLTIVPNGAFAELELFHGFPIGKYASFQLFSYDRVDYYNRKILDGLLDGESRTYVQSITGLNFAIPLIRNINTGIFNYMDALYLNIGYSLLAKVNGEFFDLDNYSHRLLTNENYSDKATVGHIINASLVVGNYKSYQFFKQFIVDVNYEILRKSMYLSISSGF